MTAADRTLAGLVIALVVSAPLVRPVWRAIDPGPADFLRACASLRAQEPVDPWGTPWIRTPSTQGLTRRPVFTDIFEVGSAGPDMRGGTQDDFPVCLQRGHPDGTYSIAGGGPGAPSESRAWPYRSAPAVPIAIALLLLATRWASARWASSGTRRGANLAARLTEACWLAIVPTIVTYHVLSVNGAWDLLFAALPIGVLSAALAARGSIFLLFVFAIFAHGEFHHSQTEGDQR